MILVHTALRSLLLGLVDSIADVDAVVDWDAEVTEVFGLTDLRVMPHPLEQRAPMPAVTYFQVSGAPLKSQDGASDVGPARFQLDLYDSSYDGAKTLARHVRAVLDGFKGTVAGVPIQAVFIEDEDDDFEDEAERYRVRLDMTVWSQEV